MRLRNKRRHYKKRRLLPVQMKSRLKVEGAYAREESRKLSSNLFKVASMSSMLWKNAPIVTNDPLILTQSYGHHVLALVKLIKILYYHSRDVLMP